MKFEELHLDGFGHFHQRTFTLSDQGLTVFYSPNEAGKSTLLAFLSRVNYSCRNRQAVLIVVDHHSRGLAHPPGHPARVLDGPHGGTAQGTGPGGSPGNDRHRALRPGHRQSQAVAARYALKAGIPT